MSPDTLPSSVIFGINLNNLPGSSDNSPMQADPTSRRISTLALCKFSLVPPLKVTWDRGPPTTQPCWERGLPHFKQLRKAHWLSCSMRDVSPFQGKILKVCYDGSFSLKWRLSTEVNNERNYLWICASQPQATSLSLRETQGFYPNSTGTKLGLRQADKEGGFQLVVGPCWQLVRNCPSPAPPSISSSHKAWQFDGRTKVVTSPTATESLLIYLCLTDKESRCHQQNASLTWAKCARTALSPAGPTLQEGSK